MNRTTHQIEPEEVMAYLDGELTAEQASAVAAHIESCAECAAVAADLRGLSARMATWQIESAPETLNGTIEKATAEPAEHHNRARKFQFVWNRTIFPRWVWGSAFAAAGILLIASLATRRMASPSMNRSVGMVDVSPQTQRTGAPSASGGGGGSSLSMRMRTSKDWDPAQVAREGQANYDLRIPFASKDLERPAPGEPGPMMIRTASVTLETKQFDLTRAALERIVRKHDGHVGQLQTAAPSNEARTLTATLRIPTDQLDAALAEVKKLGRVAHESQSGEEVTEQYVDLVARLANSRHTEQRLVEILRTRTGKVEEVLEVEREIASVREEIERMEAQRKSLENRVALATVNLELREEFEKPLGVTQPSPGMLLWNAMADGLDGAFESVLALGVFLLRAGPSLLLWGALLFLPARSVYRRMRAAAAQ